MCLGIVSMVQKVMGLDYCHWLPMLLKQPKNLPEKMCINVLVARMGNHPSYLLWGVSKYKVSSISFLFWLKIPPVKILCIVSWSAAADPHCFIWSAHLPQMAKCHSSVKQYLSVSHSKWRESLLQVSHILLCLCLYLCILSTFKVKVKVKV